MEGEVHSIHTTTAPPSHQQLSHNEIDDIIQHPIANVEVTQACVPATATTYPMIMQLEGHAYAPAQPAVLPQYGVAYVPATDAANYAGVARSHQQQACVYYPSAYYAALQAQQQRIALQTDFAEEPVYVNAKQYAAILRRREQRAKQEAGTRWKPVVCNTTHISQDTYRLPGETQQRTNSSRRASPTCTNHGMPMPPAAFEVPGAVFSLLLKPRHCESSSRSRDWAGRAPQPPLHNNSPAAAAQAHKLVVKGVGMGAVWGQATVRVVQAAATMQRKWWGKTWPQRTFLLRCIPRHPNSGFVCETMCVMYKSLECICGSSNIITTRNYDALQCDVAECVRFFVCFNYLHTI